MRKIIFFDRDGTLIEHVHHLVSTDLVELKPDLGISLKRLFDEGYSLGMVTNQSVISRGLASEAEVEKINDVILNYLNSCGVFMDFVLICPHQDIDECKCRKPKIGLVRNHILLKDMDTANSFMVGDQSSDIEFGLNLGIRTAQITNSESPDLRADFIGSSLAETATWILEVGISK
jgi:histidinol-phosphatase